MAAKTPTKKKTRRAAPARQTVRTRKKDRQKKTFLREMRKHGVVTVAAAKAHAGRATVYEWREEDPDFARAWDDAEEESTGLLEVEAHRRAHGGWLEPVFQGGKRVGQVRRFSHTLLMFLLNGRKPEVYRQRHSHEVGGPNGGPIPLATWAELVKSASEE